MQTFSGIVYSAKHLPPPPPPTHTISFSVSKKPIINLVPFFSGKKHSSAVHSVVCFLFFLSIAVSLERQNEDFNFFENGKCEIIAKISSTNIC